MTQKRKMRADGDRYAWSDSDVERLNRQVFSGLSIFYEDYSDHGLPVATVYQKNDFISNNNKNKNVFCKRAVTELTSQEMIDVERDLTDGVDRKSICDKYNITSKTLKNKCAKMGLDWGEKSSLAHPLRDAAFEMLLNGKSVREIEEELGITYHLIHRWKTKLKGEGRLS